MNLSRRSLLVGATSVLVAAPAIVRATSLMPVKVMLGMDGNRISAFELGDAIAYRGHNWKVVRRYLWMESAHRATTELTIARCRYDKSIRSILPTFMNLYVPDLSFRLGDLSLPTEPVTNLSTSKAYMAAAEHVADYCSRGWFDPTRL